MEVRISEKAKRQLKNIYDYFSETSIHYADNFVQEFYSKSEALKEFPEMYEIVPQLKNLRIRKFRIGSYRILYQIDDIEGIIKIIAISHTKQQYSL